MSETNSELSWLIRDTSNRIRGPYGRNEILAMIKKGQIKPKVEISCANTYWFALEEKPEVARFFPELTGGKLGDAPTQMTATMNQPMPDAVEITQFVAAPSRQDLAQTAKQAEDEPKAEWLDPDMAAEFAEFTGSVQLDMELADPNAVPNPEPPPFGAAPDLEFTKPGLNAPPVAAASMPAPAPPANAGRDPVFQGFHSDSDDEKTLTATPEEMQSKHGGDPRTRSQSMADALPSELLNYQGARPRPLDSVFKGQDRPAAPTPAPLNMVSVPVESHDRGAHIIHQEDEDAEKAKTRKNVLVGVGVAAAAALLVGGWFLMPARPVRKSEGSAAVKTIGEIEPQLKKSLLLFDLDAAKDALADYELNPSSRAKPTLPLAQAILRKEFMFDTEGALGALQTARALSSDPRPLAEIDNLMSVYRYERDPAGAIDDLKRLAETNPAEPVFRYNWALGLQRANRSQEAISALTPLFSSLQKGTPLLEDAAVALGWARDSSSKGADAGAESAFQRALEANPDSSKGRLGLAIYHLRRGGLRDSESDFRAFIDSLPELDMPKEVPNFRKMSDFDFYQYARSQLAELNMPGSVVGSRPSPLVMAADAILSSIQSQDGDANRIVSDAAKSAPGDLYVLKAMAYLYWKESKYAEITDLFKDADRERGSYPASVLLGKANLKLGRKDIAAQYFSSIISGTPARSDGWSLQGDVLLAQGKAAEAEKDFRQALSRDPFDLIALRGLNQLKQKNLISPEIARNLPF